MVNPDYSRGAKLAVSIWVYSSCCKMCFLNVVRFLAFSVSISYVPNGLYLSPFSCLLESSLTSLINYTYATQCLLDMIVSVTKIDQPW